MVHAIHFLGFFFASFHPLCAYFLSQNSSRRHSRTSIQPCGNRLHATGSCEDLACELFPWFHIFKLLLNTSCELQNYQLSACVLNLPGFDVPSRFLLTNSSRYSPTKRELENATLYNVTYADGDVNPLAIFSFQLSVQR